MAAHADPHFFLFVENTSFPENSVLRIGDGQENFTTYRLGKLYIVNGALKHRDWGPNTVIGRIGFALAPAEETDGN